MIKFLQLEFFSKYSIFFFIFAPVLYYFNMEYYSIFFSLNFFSSINYFFFHFSDIFFFELKFFEYINFLVIIIIIFLLLKNILYHSVEYYFIKFIFSFKRKLNYNLRNLFLDAFLVVFLRSYPEVLPKKYSDTVFCCLLLSFISFFLNFYEKSFFLDEIISSKTFNIIPWISYSFDRNYFGICSDSLSLFMLIIVLSISTFVHYYSIDYMYSDPRLITFLKYLSGFTLAMLLLILSNNMAFLFLGWEGVGIFSYLLIGFWYT